MPSYTCEARARTLLSPYLQQRLDAFSAGVKPRNDLLQFLIDEAPSHERNVNHLVQALFAVHAAVQSATTFFIANAIFMLSSDPEQYMPELRAEAQKHLLGGKINKSALDKLVKLDSFLRESARLNNAFLLTAERLVMQDFCFSDGTLIPKGATLAVPQIALHCNANTYPDPTFFDPWRYARIRESMSGLEGAWGGPGMQLPDTNGSDYVHFGHNKHTW
jgi:cytochrome P450